MNLLSQFESMFASEEKSIATVIGDKGGGVWVGKTLGGAMVLLQSTGSTVIGKQMYYDRVSGRVLGDAPNVMFSEYGV